MCSSDLSHCIGIRDDSMRQAKRPALQTLLRGSAKAIGLAFVGNARADPRQRRGRHPENVCIKVVRVNDVDLILFDEMNQAAKLSGEVEIVEAVERIFVDFTNTKLIGFRAERAAILQAGETDTALSAGVQLRQELHGLALASTLLETIDDE